MTPFYFDLGSKCLHNLPRQEAEAECQLLQLAVKKDLSPDIEEKSSSTALLIIC